MEAPPLPRNPSTAFHSLIRRLFTQSAQEPSNVLERAIFFLFNVFNDVLHHRSTYKKFEMTPEDWFMLNMYLDFIEISELSVFSRIAFQIFSLNYDCLTHTMTVCSPNETQHTFASYLTFTIEEMLYMARAEHPTDSARIGKFKATSRFPLRHAAVGVPPISTLDGTWVYSTRTPSVVVYDDSQGQQPPLCPLIIDVCDETRHQDQHAAARHYLAGDDRRPSVFLSITLLPESPTGQQIGTYSFWRSRVLPGQPVGNDGRYPNTTKYEPECLTQDRPFTLDGTAAVQDDNDTSGIFISFGDISPRNDGRTRTAPSDTAAGTEHCDGIRISFQRLADIWYLARHGMKYTGSDEFVRWDNAITNGLRSRPANY